MTLEESLDKLAGNIAKKAEEKDVTLDEKVKALKALTQLLAVKNKNKLPPDEDEGAGANFEEFAGITDERGTNGGKTRVSSRRADS